MHKHIKFYFFFFIFLFLTEYTKASTGEEFKIWLKNFKTEAIEKGISEQTVTLVFKNARYLEKVIKYDRRQPEFIELTEIYVNKRATKKRAQKAKELYEDGAIGEIVMLDMYNDRNSTIKLELSTLPNHNFYKKRHPPKKRPPPKRHK